MTDNASPPPPPPPPPVAAPGHPLAVGRGEPGKRRSVGLTILLSIVTCGIWTLVWSYKTGDELKRWRNDGIGGVGYLLITFFVSPVTMFLMASEVEKAYRDEGRDPPITTLWGLWFLLPIIGLFVWYIKIQGALNDYWTLHGQSNDPGL